MAVTDFKASIMRQEHPTIEPLHGAPALRAKQQGGSVLIQFAIFLSITMLILGVVDLGYSFYAKRDLQRIADLTAIEAVQGITSNDPLACKKAGALSVEANWPAPINRTMTDPVVCGEWNPHTHPDPQGRYFGANITPQNAAQVVLTGETPRFIPGPWSRSIRAEAIAQRTEQTASFQIGSQLLNLNKNAPLGKVLTLIGLDANKLTVLDANGLANAKISPSGLFKALGVDLGIGGLAVLTPQQLVKLNNFSLGKILNASLDVISDDTLKADINAAVVAIQKLKIDGVRLLDMKIPLLRESGTTAPGIFTFLSLGQDTSPNGAALDTQIGVGSILNTAIMIAANGHALAIPNTNILDTVKLELTVVEPPTIAFGLGSKANSSQIRLNLDIDSNRLPILGNLLTVLGLGARVHLPIKVNGVSADATLVKTHQCTKGTPKGTIDVHVISRVAQITIGNPAPDNILIKLPLLPEVRGPVTVDVLKTSPQTLEAIAKDQSKWTKPNELLLGDTVDSLTDALFNLLGGLFPLGALLDPVKWLLNIVGKDILSPLLTTVLGLELGSNEVKALEINCTSAELVF